MTVRKQFIEVALPLEAVNVASAREIYRRSVDGILESIDKQSRVERTIDVRHLEIDPLTKEAIVKQSSTNSP